MVEKIHPIMTRDIDLSKMTNSKEILPQFRDQLEEEIKDVFIWATGQLAITEMTKTVKERTNFFNPYTDFTHFSDYTSFPSGTNTTAEISSI